MRLLHDDRLARRLDEALTYEGEAYVEAWMRVYPEAGADLLRVGGGCALFTGVASPVTQVVGLGREREVTAGDLDAIEEFFAARGAVSRVNLTPFAHPSLAEQLGRRGYRIEEFENAMARALEPTEAFPLDLPADIDVRRLREEETEEWAYTVASGFASLEPTDDPDGSHIALARLSPAIRGVTAFIAAAEGKAVAGASLSAHDGIGTMFGDATLPAWRGRGIQTGLLSVRLEQAAKAGCDLAAAGTSPGSTSQRNMERLGFEVAYTQVMMVLDRQG